VPSPAKRSQGNHDPSRGPRRSGADSRAGAFDAVAGLRPSVGDVDWPRGVVAAGFSSTLVAAVALPTVTMAADAEDEATGTTLTVSEHNLGHGAILLARITLHETTDDARLRRG
jgi:hypothetical protein